MANLAVVKICLCLLLVLFTAMPTTASAAQKSDRFRKALVSFTEHLVFDQPAKSRVHCVVLCSGTPCCDRAIFAEGKCRGHRRTPESGGNVTTVWERAREQVFTNVAYGKPAVQSFTLMDWIASRAVDGNPDSPHCSRTLTNPLFTHWWQVDLQAIYSVTSVTIDNTDAEYLRDFDIHMYTEDPQTNPFATGSLCHHQDGQVADLLLTLHCRDTTAPGRFLRITTTYIYLWLCEVEVEVAACLVSP